MTTPNELREQAARHDQDAAESFDRCDTDGFLSQWASGISAQMKRMQAELLESGGKEFSALFDLQGNLIAAKLIETRFGLAWGILESDDPFSDIVSWFNDSKARDETKQRANNARKGYYVGKIKTTSVKAEIMGSGTGLSGAASAYVGIKRTDGGFSRNVEIIDNGQGE